MERVAWCCETRSGCDRLPTTELQRNDSAECGGDQLHVPSLPRAPVRALRLGWHLSPPIRPGYLPCALQAASNKSSFGLAPVALTSDPALRWLVRGGSQYRYVRSSTRNMSAACPASAADLYRDHRLPPALQCYGGCQCKMLLGMNCVGCPALPAAEAAGEREPRHARGSNLTARQLEQCVGAVGRMRFVGTLEAWRASMHAFCERFQCGAAVRAAVLRRGRSNPAPPCPVPSGWADDADEAVYNAVLARVRREADASRRTEPLAVQ